MKFQYKFLTALMLLAQVNAGTIFAATPTWLNGTTDLNLGTNWNIMSVPTSVDDVVFNNSGNTNPTLSSSPDFEINSATFASTPYTFTLSGPNFIFSGDHSSSGPITLAGDPAVQNFNLPPSGGTISFRGSASADVTGEGHVHYSADFKTTIFFQDTSVGSNAQINLTGGGSTAFEDTSDAQTINIVSDDSFTFFSTSATANAAVINAINTSEITFRNNSVGATSSLNLKTGSSLSFENASSPQSSTIGADGSSINFNTSVASGGGNGDPTVNILNVSNIDVTQNITLGSLASDSSSTVDLISNLTVGTNNTSTTFAGIMSDTGTFTKVGTGTLTFSGNNTYTGLTTVQAGELKLNGQIAGDAIVALNALISGTGTIGGSLTVNGTVSPGNSIGTLNVTGNYIQNAGSTYFLEINGLGQADLINVTGAATLNGGQVVVTSLDGSALGNTPYTILTAAGGLNGTFAGVSTTNLLIVPTLSYDANNAYLTFAQTVFHFDAVTPNQIAVATQLESITDPTAEELLILNTLAALTPAEQQAALNQMSGEQYASLNLAAEIAGRQFIRRLYDPLRSIVTTEPCNDCCYSCPCPTLDVWFEAGGGQTFLDGNSNARGYKMSGYEVTAGIQSTFNRDWTLGIAGSYAEDHIKYDIGNNGKNRMGFGAIYGLYRPSNFYVLADLAFGGGQFIVNRSIDIGDLAYTTKGRPNHYQGLAYIEAGFDWNTCNFLIQPFLGFEGGYFRRNSISETGTSPLNLDINRQSYGNAFSRLGVHLTTEQWSALKLSVDLAWDCRLTSTKRSITENFQGFGDAFAITGIPGHRNSVDVAVTGITKLCGGWELYLEAGGEFWSKVSTYNVLGGVKYSW